MRRPIREHAEHVVSELAGSAFDSVDSPGAIPFALALILIVILLAVVLVGLEWILLVAIVPAIGAGVGAVYRRIRRRRTTPTGP